MICRGSIRIVATFALVSLACNGTPGTAQIIANGGFEAPSDEPPVLGQWQYMSGAIRGSASVHGGSFAADMNNLAEATNVNVFQQTTPGSIAAGTQYTLSYWALADYGVSGIGQVQLAFLNEAGNILPGSPQFTNIPASASFVNYTHNFTAPINASALFVAFNSVTGAVTGATAHLVVDDVSFTPASGGFAPADFNQDTFVNGGDLAAWETAFGLTGAADADDDDDSDGADLLIWQRDQTTPSIAAIPEPATIGGALLSLGLFFSRRLRGGHTLA